MAHCLLRVDLWLRTEQPYNHPSPAQSTGRHDTGWMCGIIETLMRLEFGHKVLSEKYFPSLNGWRAIAVMLVIGAHSVTMNSHTAIGEETAKILDHAGVGVDLFFAISGYLICTLLLKEKARGSISLRDFYKRRAFPNHAICRGQCGPSRRTEVIQHSSSDYLFRTCGSRSVCPELCRRELVYATLLVAYGNINNMN
jgi:hypothetical protein